MACSATMVTYQPPGYAASLLRNLHRQLRNGDFCDVELLVGGNVFNAHRTILSASSPYFNAMFTGGLSEAEKRRITIKGIPNAIFHKLLQFIYTGEVTVTEETCQDLLAAADLLGLSDVLESCCTFMKKQLHPSNCLGFYMFAERHGCCTLKPDCETYIHSHFLEVIQEEEFLLISKDLLISLLQSENLQVEDEFQVFKAGMSWILYQVVKRRRHVFDILGAIRIPIVSTRQLDKYLSECPDLSLKIAVNKIVQDFHGYRKSPHDLQMARCKPYLYQPRRCARKRVYVVGGYRREQGGRWSDSLPMASMECFHCFPQTWHHAPELHHPRSGHGVAVLNGLIYAIGGESDSLIYDNAESYDPSTNKWSMIPSMTVPRCGLGVCVVDNKIYAIGGWIGAEIGSTIEKFDPELNLWSYADKVHTPRFAMGVVEHDGLIYILGGMSDVGTEMHLVESFNPVLREHTRLADMHVERAYVGVAAMDGFVYAVGGWNEESGSLDSVERYSIEEDSWKMVTPMTFARAGVSVAAVNGMLFVIGGRSSCDDFAAPYTLDSVECYDTQMDSWLPVPNLLTSRCEACVAVL